MSPLRRCAATAVAAAVTAAVTASVPLASAAPFDGQPAMVEELNPGTADGVMGFQPGVKYEIARLHRKVYFAGDDGVHGSELWVSDGTRAGTRMVLDLAPGGDGSAPRYLVAYRGQVYFQARGPLSGGETQNELWASDGTAKGTRLVKDVGGSAVNGMVEGIAVSAGRLWFAARSVVGGEPTGAEPFVSDGTTKGTRLVKDLTAGSSSSNASDFTSFDGKTFFRAEGGGLGTELFRSDGTRSGTRLVKDIDPAGSGFPRELTKVGDTLLFTAADPSEGRELWRTDGTTAGTQRLEAFIGGATDGEPSGLTRHAGEVWFAAAAAGEGVQLWHTDGTPAGTEKQTALDVGGGGLSPRSLTSAGDKLFFFADWPSTETLCVFTVAGGVDDVETFVNDGPTWPMTVVDGRVFFPARSSGEEREMFVSDGTDQGTHVLLDVHPDGDSTPSPAYRIHHTAFFTAWSPDTGREPYAYTARGSTTKAKPASSYTPVTAQKKRIRVPVVVAAGGSKAYGDVVLREGSVVVGRAEVEKGRALVRIRKVLSTGSHTLTAKYSGSWVARRSTSEPFEVVVG